MRLGILIIISSLFFSVYADDIQELKNPFFIPILDKISNLKFQAMFLDKVKIDGNWYKKDDFIYGAKIINIDNFSIYLKYKEQDFKISLLNDKIIID